jgi:levanase
MLRIISVYNGNVLEVSGEGILTLNDWDPGLESQQWTFRLK